MTRARRWVALLALLAVGWTALWPLVSAAHAEAMSEPMPLCHQAGGMVSMDVAPQGPSVPGVPKQHCPLCVMAFYCSFSEPPKPPPFGYSTVTVLREVPRIQHTHRVEVAIPFGRAPPVSSLG
jgi:Protein of unknown function (DUF2946)